MNEYLLATVVQYAFLLLCIWKNAENSIQLKNRVKMKFD